MEFCCALYPFVMPIGWLAAVGIVNSVTTPDGVIRPILLPLLSVNQIAPSEPAVVQLGELFIVGIGNSVMTPDGVIRPI
jgi:hypothetical protein